MKKILLLPTLLLSFPLANLATPKLPNLKQLECLATNVYREARGEPFIGQVAVAKVTLNRVKNKQFPNTICKVVYQRKQFSWTSKYKNVVYSMESLEASLAALRSKSNFSATHYHNTKVSPKWGLKLLGRIGNHIFYV